MSPLARCRSHQCPLRVETGGARREAQTHGLKILDSFSLTTELVELLLSLEPLGLIRSFLLT